MTRAWLIAIALAACSTTAKPDFDPQVDVTVDGVTSRADMFGGGDRQQIGITIAPKQLVVGGEGLTQLDLRVDISQLVGFGTEMMTVCDPRVVMDFSRGGDTFNIKAGTPTSRRARSAATMERSTGSSHSGSSTSAEPRWT